jgi:hypothetical protein
MSILRETNEDRDEFQTKGIAKNNDSPEKRNVKLMIKGF